MARQIPFWLRETLRAWMQYLALGIASIPTTFVFIELHKIGLGFPYLIGISVFICAVLAYLAWKLLSRNLLSKPTAKADYPQVAATHGQAQIAKVHYVSSMNIVYIVRTVPHTKTNGITHNTSETATAAGYDLLKIPA
ncbi:MAG: hypothetical protein ACR2LC_15065 [Pyrinomonadaceae bacterium]